MKNSIKEYLKSKPYIHKKVVAIKNFFFVELPNLIKYKKIEKRQFFVIDDKKMIYLSNCKVACSSIKKTFVEGRVSDDYSVNFKVEELRKEKLSPKEDEYFKFSFVRSPFSRLVSCYVSKYIKDKEYLDILEFDKVLLGLLHKDKGFDNFIKRINRIPDFYANAHFMSQYNLLYDKKGNCIVDYIGKFENLEEDFSGIKTKYELLDLPHFNKTGTRNWMDYYTIETANIVRKKYAKEIESFGYENDYNNLIEYINKKN